MITFVGPRAQRRDIYVAAQLASALGLAGLAWLDPLLGAAVVALATGGRRGAAGALLFALVQAVTDHAYLGRVMAVV